MDATLLATRKTRKHELFNVGSEETITARKIGRLVVTGLGLEGVQFKYLGGRNGWPVDVPSMLLSIEKLKGVGWKLRFSIEESVSLTTDWLVKTS